MAIHEDIKKGIPEAMKSKNEVALRTYRSLSSAMTNEVVAKKRKPDEFLTDEEATAVLKRAANQRRDSITQFVSAGREELATPEREELALIESLLPATMSREEITVVAERIITSLGADKSKAGMVMGAVMKELKGKADGGDVKAVIDTLLA